MDDAMVQKIADLLSKRNVIDATIAEITARPMTSGHLGEWLASKVFGIELEASASAPGIDGRFTSGPLAGRTVNVKWYLKREGILDVTESEHLDYYLVLAGPPSAAVSSRGGVRPWCIASVHLFDARDLLVDLRGRGVKTGVAASVRQTHWAAAEVYPHERSRLLTLTHDQIELLRLLSPERQTND